MPLYTTLRKRKPSFILNALRLEVKYYMRKNRRYIAITAFMCSVLLLAFIMWPDVKNVTIVDGANISNVKTTLTDVKSLLQKQGISIAEQDKVEPGLDELLTSGMEIKVFRAKDVSITVDNKMTVIKTTLNITGSVLEEAGIILGELDRVTPGVAELCNDVISVVRVKKSEITEEKKIAYPVEKVNDDNLYKGEQRVIEKGSAGIERYTYEVVYEDDKQVERKLLDKSVVKEPIKQVLAVGTLQIASRGGSPISFKQVIDMKASGYTHTGRRTYTDIWPTVGTVAVDPSVIPLGSRLYIDGYGYATAMDIGGSIKGNRIDLFFDSRQEALSWGLRTVKVFILE